MTICHGSPWCRNVADDHCPFSIRGWWVFFYPLSYLTLTEQLLVEHGPTREDVIAWAKNEVRIETEKYKKEKEAKTVLIPFHADRQLDYNKQTFYRGGYIFLQSIYYQIHIEKICRKLKLKYKFQYDINAILSDLIYARILVQYCLNISD